MKLRNKKTGVIVDVLANPVFTEYNRDGSVKNVVIFNSLAELNEEWEDYEEPKGYWYIDDAGVIQIDQVLCSEINMRKSIGNYFSSREEAEKAVEKLKAWKRLKDKGFEINDWAVADNYEIRLFGHYSRAGIKDDLDLLLGGEE